MLSLPVGRQAFRNIAKKAEIIPDNLHRIMPAKGENTAPPNPFLGRGIKSGLYLPRIFSSNVY
jgi:hypothetical protein